ncbi:MAG: xanthine dehydrogenase family protein molybdopterin-binding subunit [Firmicutes bacterium]|nr:molybdopterin-dependent oxidoreductase [Alicyclobacillaceae bacterium]MCL6496566.1 xanthine dehydrogenase family protein molybdopterin-binding subunit [Bacillota bacterium]
MNALIGQPVRRREDARLVVGRGQFTDDVQLPGMVYAVMVRSPHAHARIRGIDASRALGMPGVLAVFTGRDLEGVLGSVPTAWIPPNSDLKQTPHRPLAVDTVRYVGDAVAMVVAEDRYVARDAAEAVVVDYEPLPAVADVMAAVAEGAPLVHADAPGNIALHWKAGEVPDEVFARAEVVVRQRFRQQRLIPNPMEPRAAVAQYDSATGHLTVWMTSQNPHIHRFILAGILGIPEHHLRVVAQDVGGGFGSKISCYPDEALVAHAARVLRRPVKWVEDRSEHFTATTHGRDHVQEVELAGRRDGTIEALRVKAWANLGAYLSTAAPGVPTILFGLIVNGCYRIPQASTEVFGVYTHTTPVDAYRGAGRPEATYLIERMIDLFADAIGMDPVEVRRKNFVPRDQFPYTNPFGITYDSGDYERALQRALERIDYAALRREQAALRAQGRYLGIGFSTYVEMCGLGPSEVAGAVGFQGGLWEHATVRVHPSGKVQVFTGASPHGQGEETTFAQIVAEKLGVPFEDIEVVHGDTDRITMGWGTYGSRSLAVGGSALAVACQRLVEKGQRIAAHRLEAAVEDVVFEAGRYQVRGVPDRSLGFQEVALQAHLAWNLPPGVEPGMEASSAYNPSNFTFPFGTHVAVVEVDPATGAVELKRYVAVDDCGTPINPLIIAGQVHGGIVQGVGQALWEGAVYGEDGQLLTTSFLDYAMPKARFFPPIETEATVTPSPHNPLGVKGVGETGTIAATPAVVNAVIDALKPWNVRHLDMPLTPERVWRAIHGKGAQG